jgi:hypothetical protein
VVILIGLSSFYVINSFELKNLEAKEKTLIENIKSLGQTEQSFFLIRDRLSKIKMVLAEDSTNKSLENLTLLLGVFPAAATINEVDITAKKADISFTVSGSSLLVQIFASVVSSDFYKNIYLKSFGYNPSSGYAITLEVVNN